MEVRFLVFRSSNLGTLMSSITNLFYQGTKIEVFGPSVFCIDKASVVVWILGWLLSELVLAVDPADRTATLLNERRIFELLFGHSE